MLVMNLIFYRKRINWIPYLTGSGRRDDRTESYACWARVKQVVPQGQATYDRELQVLEVRDLLDDMDDVAGSVF
jgi:hypothetical protein